ncbi:MAG: metallophosphoesterase [Phycisphaerae bacterium]|nr:metallophosphoesterase [Phycisphaerae bacterium]
MAQKTIDLCNKAAELNYSDKLRHGNIIELPPKGRLIITGDLHGHKKNFKRITAFADLASNPDTYVIFQEILHGGEEDPHGGCLSFVLFFDILRLKLKFPDQVHLIMGNHDTAIVTDSNVMKDGKEMNEAFKTSLRKRFKEDFEEVNEAIREYLLSQPIAAKTTSGIWVSHSIPADRYISNFDHEVFDRELFPDDLLRGEPAYLLTWGRKHSQEKLDEFAKALGVKTFILGHQKQDTGFNKAGDNLIILTSEHNHGCLIAFDIEKQYTTDELVECIVPLAAIEA